MKKVITTVIVVVLVFVTGIFNMVAMAAPEESDVTVAAEYTDKLYVIYWGDDETNTYELVNVIKESDLEPVYGITDIYKEIDDMKVECENVGYYGFDYIRTTDGYGVESVYIWTSIHPTTVTTVTY